MGEGLKRKAMLVVALLVLTVGVEGTTRLAGAASVPNYWPNPDGCLKLAPTSYEACRGCCITTVNTWISPWCDKNTPPGPQREECQEGAITWLKMCLDDCKPISTSGGSGPVSPFGN